MSLSDILEPKVVELGAIKIGGLGEERPTRSGGTFRLPVKYDHIVVTSKFRGQNGQLSPDTEVMDALSEYADADGKLRQIPIAVLSDEISDFMRASWVHYRGKACYARSDGVTVWKYYDFKTGQKLEEPEEAPWEPRFAGITVRVGSSDVAMFKKHVALDCVIAVPEARWGGVYRFRTTSVITGDQMYGSLLHLKQLTGGVLTGMPLMLVVRPMQVHPEGKATTVYVVHVELRGKDLIELQTRALDIAKFQKENRQQLLTVRREMRLLMNDPGVDEDELTQAEMQQEFHPEDEEPVDTLANTLGNLDATLVGKVGCVTDQDKRAVIGWALGREFDEGFSMESLDEDEASEAFGKLANFTTPEPGGYGRKWQEILPLARGEELPEVP